MNNEKENKYSFCVIIPTYNNDKTLKGVIEGVINHVDHKKQIIIVNDGSTDRTANILKDFPDTHQIHFPENQGKGFALRKGFAKALELGFSHAITIDSDAQHLPHNIQDFILAAQENPKTLFIGARNMKSEGVPAKSSFGNKFSNFWFWFETGIKLSDTQSGFRLYPIYCMPKKWFTKKFEFEIEVIVRSAWKGIEVKNIPIAIRYDFEDRVSHFRTFTDFFRISVLNTVLVFLTLFYILPRNFIRNFKKKSFKDFLREDVLEGDDSPKIKALSIAVGVFIGIIPIWGFQTFAALFIAVSFRLNKLLTFAGSHISIPPMIPIIVFCAVKIGSFVLKTNHSFGDFSSLENAKNHLFEYVLGSFILAIFVSFTIGLLTFLFLKIKANK